MTVSKETFIYARDHQPEELNQATRADVLAALRAWLDIWKTASFIDDENIAEGGQLAGMSQHADVDVAVLDLLCADRTPNHMVAASAFLDGYWSRRPPSPSFDFGAYAGFLDGLAATDDAFAAICLALYSAVQRRGGLPPATDAPLRARLLAARSALIAANAFPGVRVYLDHLLPTGDRTAGLDLARYRGYRVDENVDEFHYLVELAAEQRAVLRMAPPAIDERQLVVQYELRDSAHGDREARALIDACILGGVMQHALRGQVDNITYVNQANPLSRTTLSYPEPG